MTQPESNATVEERKPRRASRPPENGTVRGFYAVGMAILAGGLGLSLDPGMHGIGPAAMAFGAYGGAVRAGAAGGVISTDMSAKPPQILHYKEPDELLDQRRWSKIALTALALSICPLVLLLPAAIGVFVHARFLVVIRPPAALLVVLPLTAVITSVGAMFRLSAAVGQLRGRGMSILAFVLSLLTAPVALLVGMSSAID